MSAPTIHLTERQRNVLLAVYHYEAAHHQPAYEPDVFYRGKALGYWDSKVVLYAPLNRLVQLGLIERHGVWGGYNYTLTSAGRDALVRLP